MRRIVIALGLLGGFVCAASPAQAQVCVYDAYGRMICGERVRPYAEPPYAERRYYYEGRRYRYRDPNAGCPRGWTVQDGVCKPYRGY